MDHPVPFRRLAELPLVLASAGNPFQQRIEALAAEFSDPTATGTPA